MRIAHLLATLLLAVALSSCAGGGNELEHELDKMEATVMRHERLIAECMSNRGWEYIPHLSRGAILEREQALADAQGRTFDPSSVDVPPDPNEAIVAKLSDVEKNARADAYWGDRDKGGTDPGCYRLTYEKAWGRNPLPDPAALPALDAALEADPRIIEARKRYADCMTNRGYDVRGTTDIYRIYQTKEESLKAKILEDGEDPEASSQMSTLRAERNAAYAAHDECVRDYRAVENRVRLEILRKYGNR